MKYVFITIWQQWYSGAWTIWEAVCNIMFYLSTIKSLYQTCLCMVISPSLLYKLGQDRSVHFITRMWCWWWRVEGCCSLSLHWSPETWSTPWVNHRTVTSSAAQDLIGRWELTLMKTPGTVRSAPATQRHEIHSLSEYYWDLSYSQRMCH